MRIDIEIKNISEISEIQSFLAQHSFNQINIVEKKKQLEILPYLTSLTNKPLCLHLSAKNHQMDNISEIVQQSINERITNFLIVSGIPQPKKDSISMLKQLTNFTHQAQFAVSYTPFALDQSQERERLQQKIATGLVSEIYLQMGDNKQKLQTEIQWLRTQSKIPIIGSLLIPTPAIRHKFMHTQWQGVEFDVQFFRDQHVATQHTKEHLHFLQANTDDIIIELFPFSIHEYNHYAQPIIAS